MSSKSLRIKCGGADLRCTVEMLDKHDRIRGLTLSAPMFSAGGAGLCNTIIPRLTHHHHHHHNSGIG
jgi:hypothetical protein